MTAQRDLASEAQKAVYTAIIEQTKAVDPESQGAKAASETMKNLAEAYAWVTYGNQPH